MLWSNWLPGNSPTAWPCCCTEAAPSDWPELGALAGAQGVPQYAQPWYPGCPGRGDCFSFVTWACMPRLGRRAHFAGLTAIRLGGLVLVSLAGLAFWREPLTWRYVAGMLLACGGIYLIITR